MRPSSGVSVHVACVGGASCQANQRAEFGEDQDPLRNIRSLSLHSGNAPARCGRINPRCTCPKSSAAPSVRRTFGYQERGIPQAKPLSRFSARSSRGAA